MPISTNQNKQEYYSAHIRHMSYLTHPRPLNAGIAVKDLLIANECNEVFLSDRPCQYRMHLHYSLIMEAETVPRTLEMHSVHAHLIIQNFTAQGLQVQIPHTTWMFYCVIL
jgi:hypothetical protein